MNIREQDHREVSEAQEAIRWLKEQSNSTIYYAISELNVELNERDSKFTKSMEKESAK